MVHDDVSGEAVISSPSMMDRYLNEPGATSAAFEAPGFFRTGDRVHMSLGRVFVDGRIKVSDSQVLSRGPCLLLIDRTSSKSMDGRSLQPNSKPCSCNIPKSMMQR